MAGTYIFISPFGKSCAILQSSHKHAHAQRQLQLQYQQHNSTNNKPLNKVTDLSTSPSAPRILRYGAASSHTQLLLLFPSLFSNSMLMRTNYLRSPVGSGPQLLTHSSSFPWVLGSGGLPHGDRGDAGQGRWQHPHGDRWGEEQAEWHHILHRHQPAAGAPGEHGGHVSAQERHE